MTAETVLILWKLAGSCGLIGLLLFLIGASVAAVTEGKAGESSAGTGLVLVVAGIAFGVAAALVNMWGA